MVAFQYGSLHLFNFLADLIRSLTLGGRKASKSRKIEKVNSLLKEYKIALLEVSSHTKAKQTKKKTDENFSRTGRIVLG